jgi:[acyl-carrier-protein] S-malonyltransferase
MPLLAFVFPGQGSQSVGMGRALAAASPAASAIFVEADAALGEPISSLAWDGPAEALDRTENAQPALLATSIAYLAALRERWSALGIPALEPAFYAGHSMGQYSALVAAGAIGLADGIRLVRERGRLMQATGAGREGRMAALIGLDDARLPELVERASAHGVFGVANRNSPGQVVVDVGINMTADGKLCGDVKFDDAEPIVGAITPVPGGVGTVTTSVLVSHVVEAAKKSA